MPIANQQIIPVRPTVFIGLGGTGKEILLRLRMKFYERYGVVGYPCMSYLWIDTDMQNLNVDRKAMDPVLQRVLFRGEGETVDIQVPDATNFLNNPGTFPWISEWLPPAVFQTGLRIQDGAGQVRAKGRFGFFWKFQNVKASLRQAIDRVQVPQAKTDTARFSDEHELNLRLDDNWDTVVNFFVVCSLAGGTGSGTFIDLAFLLRKIAEEQSFKPDITGLLFLSSLFTTDPEDRRSANSYAALKELEYYNYTPEAGARQTENPADDQVYALRKFEEKWAQNYPLTAVNGPPFNTCYLLDGYTAGTIVTPAHKFEVFDMASEYLFWEFYRGEFASQKRSLRPNNRQYLDHNHVESHDDAQGPFHMQKFSTGYSSFGLSWIRVPMGSRIAACSYRLSHEMLEFWERGGVMKIEEAQTALRKRNVVEEVRKAVREVLRFTGARLVEDLATTTDGAKFSDRLEGGIKEFHQLPIEEQIPSTFASGFEDRYLTRRVGAVIHDNIQPSKNQVLGAYKKSILEWILTALNSEGFIPLLGFTYKNDDGTQGKVSGYLDSLNDVILAELRTEVANLKEDFSEQKAEAEERKETFFNNFEELDGNFVLFRNLSHKILLRKCLEAEQNYAVAEVGLWVCDVAFEVLEDIKRYVEEVKSRFKAFDNDILSPVIAEFTDLHNRHQKEDKRSLSINLYLDLDQYYRLGGNPVDVKAEKEQLFKTKLPDLWPVVTQVTKEKFREIVESYGWKRMQGEFQRRFVAGAEDEPLANAVRLFNELYPPSKPNDRRNQIKIFLDGGKPYVRAQMGLGPRTPRPHEDIIIGMAGLTPPAPPGSDLFEELKTQHNLGNAEGIETEPEAILYYHELTGLPLFYLSSLEQYRQSYELFQSKPGELPMHFHRRVDLFPEVFHYKPQEARGMFNAWEIVILGTLLRVLQVESSSDDFRYFYYSGAGAEIRPIGDEKGSVRTFFKDSPTYAWCKQAIEQRKLETYGDQSKLKIYYGLLQILASQVFRINNIVLGGGDLFDVPTFQASVVRKHIGESERIAVTNGWTLPRRNPGENQTSPDWVALIDEATKGSTEIQIDRGERKDRRLFIKGIDPFVLR